MCPLKITMDGSIHETTCFKFEGFCEISPKHENAWMVS